MILVFFFIILFVFVINAIMPSSGI
jgi:hypothetical protein